MHLMLHNKEMRGKKDILHMLPSICVHTHTNIFITKGNTHDYYRLCFYNWSHGCRWYLELPPSITHSVVLLSSANNSAG